MTARTPISVLVIDDSPSNRRAITQILQSAPGIEVVDRAADGEEGLKKAELLRPDVITLDLEMPKLDGFSFLRLLQTRAPTPVIVLSSYAHPSDVFKALELGAYDFVARPKKGSLDAVRAELLEKVRAVRLVRRDEKTPAPPPPRPKPPEPGAPLVIAVGASTGGPPAVQALLAALKGTQACVLVAQHMPPLFTRAFADRLQTAVGYSVTEARSHDRLTQSRAFIAPGGKHLELIETPHGLELLVSDPIGTDKHAPSVDRLFESVARVLKSSARGIVLTGMGNDGAEGSRAIAAVNGEVWAESDQTAVISGMPQAAIKTGSVRRVLPLPSLVTELSVLARRRTP